MTLKYESHQTRLFNENFCPNVHVFDSHFQSDRIKQNVIVIMNLVLNSHSFIFYSVVLQIYSAMNGVSARSQLTDFHKIIKSF